jgi:hypothetical protein
MKTAGLILDQRIPEYPLKVLVPTGGERFIMHWTTSYDRGKVAVAHTLAALTATARRILSEHPSATILNLLRVELVSPPEFVLHRYAQHKYNEDVQHFWFDVAHRAEEALEAGVALPRELRPCPGYLEEPDLDPETDSYRTAAEDERHSYCRVCDNKVSPAEGLTPADLYEMARVRYRELGAKERPHYHRSYARPRNEPEPRVSAAPAADPHRLLFAALVNAGDHAEGIVLSPVEPLDLEDWPGNANFQSSETSRPVAFFFHLIEPLDPAPFEEMKKVAKRVEKKQEQREKVDYEAKRRAEQKARIDSLAWLFQRPA